MTGTELNHSVRLGFEGYREGCLHSAPLAVNVAEACASRTQILDSQLTANDDVAASARFHLESIGVRTVHFPTKLCLIYRGLLPCFLMGPCFSDCRIADLCRRLAAQVSQLSNVGSIPIARSIAHDDSIVLTRLTR